MNDLASLDISSALSATKAICTVDILGSLEDGDIEASASMASIQRDRRAELREAPDSAPYDSSIDTDPAALKKLRERHHSVARLLAAGYTQTVIAKLVGYTDAYVSTLLNNPAMKELVHTYSAKHDSGAEIIAENLRTAAGLALDTLTERLSNPETAAGMKDEALVSISKLGFDRAGHGPTTTQRVHKEEHFLDHAELRKLDRDARNESRDRIIPKPARQLPAPTPDETDNGSDA